MNQILFSLIGAAVLTCSSASASTVIFRVEGVIEDASANMQSLIGSRYVVETQWQSGEEVLGAPQLLGGTIRVGGQEFTSVYFRSNAEVDQIYLLFTERSTELAVPGFGARLDFSSVTPFINQGGYFPAGFQDWNLPIAESFSFSFFNYIQGQNGSLADSFVVSSPHYTSLTLTIIPEPACSSLAALAMLGGLAQRRRRVLSES